MKETEPLWAYEQIVHRGLYPFGAGTGAPRTRSGDSPPFYADGMPQKFRCEGSTLIITPPVRILLDGRIHVNESARSRYPRCGVYVRP